MKKYFKLIPFLETDLDIKINVEVEFINNTCLLTYDFSGLDVNKILYPPQVSQPRRVHDLWKHTCLEFFYKSKNNPQYWEINYAPSGNWNCYHFDNYRQGMKEESEIKNISGNRKSFSAPILCQSDFLEIQISCAIETLEKQIHYYAIAHPAGKADFHTHNCFKSF